MRYLLLALAATMLSACGATERVITAAVTPAPVVVQRPVYQPVYVAPRPWHRRGW